MKLLLLSTLLLAACGPATLQSYTLVGTEGGKNRYSLSGYTEPGEMEPNDSLRHVQHSLSDVCPNGVKVISLNEEPSGNVAGPFWLWEAIAECR